jgi:hypothetical protein
MDLDSANGLLDMLALQAWSYDLAVQQVEQADMASARISWLSAALECAYGCAEIAGRLRDVHPNAANRIANTWRDLAAGIAVAREKVVRDRRADLAELVGRV